MYNEIMKILIVSDIHGSYDSANKIKALNESLNPDNIICLGDFNYHGPRNPIPENYDPKKVVEILNSFKDKMIGVRGNCDADVEQMLYEFPMMAYLLEMEFENHIAFLSHGHKYNEDKLPPLKENDIFMYGHTHLPVAKYENGHYIFNPGSITLPKQKHPRTYGILDNTGLHIYTLEDELYMEVLFK